MNPRRASARLKKLGINWPHISPLDRASLEQTEPAAMNALLSEVPTDDDEIEIVVEMDEDGKVLATKKIANPMPMYKRLGFKNVDELCAASRQDATTDRNTTSYIT